MIKIIKTNNFDEVFEVYQVLPCVVLFCLVWFCLVVWFLFRPTSQHKPTHGQTIQNKPTSKHFPKHGQFGLCGGFGVFNSCFRQGFRNVLLFG